MVVAWSKMVFSSRSNSHDDGPTVIFQRPSVPRLAERTSVGTASWIGSPAGLQDGLTLVVQHLGAGPGDPRRRWQCWLKGILSRWTKTGCMVAIFLGKDLDMIRYAANIIRQTAPYHSDHQIIRSIWSTYMIPHHWYPWRRCHNVSIDLLASKFCWWLWQHLSICLSIYLPTYLI